jgi:hypothetical protein
MQKPAFLANLTRAIGLLSLEEIELKDESLAKVLDMVRQAHHKREKVNNFNPASVHPELVEG